jgi:hypothetical protein
MKSGIGFLPYVIGQFSFDLYPSSEAPLYMEQKYDVTEEDWFN